MAVAWYAVKVWKLTSPDGQVTRWGTRLSHSWVWEDWTLTKDNGTTLTVPMNVHPKYLPDGVNLLQVSQVLDADPVAGETPTAALARVEYVGTNPIEAADVNVTLNTKAKWDALVAQYPSLKGRFLDQPYYPATG